MIYIYDDIYLCESLCYTPETNNTINELYFHKKEFRYTFIFRNSISTMVIGLWETVLVCKQNIYRLQN